LPLASTSATALAGGVTSSTAKVLEKPRDVDSSNSVRYFFPPFFNSPKNIYHVLSCLFFQAPYFTVANCSVFLENFSTKQFPWFLRRDDVLDPEILAYQSSSTFPSRSILWPCV
jgi:hypothetical protein